MKRLSFVVSVALLMLVVTLGISYAQNFPTDRGSMMLAGDFVFSNLGGKFYEDTTGNNKTYINSNVSYSYFVLPGLSFGIKGSYGRIGEGETTQETKKHIASTWGIGPQITYFIWGHSQPASIKGKLYPYINAAFLYSRSIAKETWKNLNNEEQKSLMTTISMKSSVGFGFMVMISDYIGIYAEVSYDSETFNLDKWEYKGDDTLDGKKINVLLGISSFLY